MFTNSENIAEANRIFNKLNVKPLQEVAAKGKALAAASRKKIFTTKSQRSTGLARKRPHR
jgi:hypothetical protein